MLRTPQVTREATATLGLLLFIAWYVPPLVNLSSLFLPGSPLFACSSPRLFFSSDEPGVQPASCALQQTQQGLFQQAANDFGTTHPLREHHSEGVVDRKD